VVVGAAGLYEARCRTHFEPFTDEHHSEQLDLLTAYLSADQREVHE
jgi:thymidine kinase